MLNVKTPFLYLNRKNEKKKRILIISKHALEILRLFEKFSIWIFVLLAYQPVMVI